MSFDCYFRLKWQDPRLISAARFLLDDNQRAAIERTAQELSASMKEELRLLTQPPPSDEPTSSTPTATTDTPGAATSLDFVTLGEEYALAMWSPDLFFPDAVDIKRPGKGSEYSVFLLVEFHSVTQPTFFVAELSYSPFGISYSRYEKEII